MVKIVILAIIALVVISVLVVPPTTGNRLQSNYGNILANTLGFGGHTERNRNRYGDGSNHHYRRHGHIYPIRVVLV